LVGHPLPPLHFLLADLRHCALPLNELADAIHRNRWLLLGLRNLLRRDVIGIEMKHRLLRREIIRLNLRLSLSLRLLLTINVIMQS
jgi:hypothetical protein